MNNDTHDVITVFCACKAAKKKIDALWVNNN